MSEIFSMRAKAISQEMEDAVQWAVATANDNSHGYSQSRRWGNPDYDCSSFVISALRAAGINTGDASTTGNLKSNLTAHGFLWISRGSHALSDVSWLQRGDILLSGGHTEIYLGNRQNVGAHQSYGYTQAGDQNGKEISVGNYWYDSRYGNWQGVLRYNGTIIDTCTEDYAGNYEVTASQLLNLRSGHGTWSDILDEIPRGTILYVSKADGQWAHVIYNGQEGLCSMSLLSRIDSAETSLMGDVNADGQFDVNDVVILQKWLLGTGGLDNWEHADFNHDEILNVFDLIAMKKALLEMQK